MSTSWHTFPFDVLENLPIVIDYKNDAGNTRDVLVNDYHLYHITTDGGQVVPRGTLAWRTVYQVTLGKFIMMDIYILDLRS